MTLKKFLRIIVESKNDDLSITDIDNSKNKSNEDNNESKYMSIQRKWRDFKLNQLLNSGFTKNKKEIQIKCKELVKEKLNKNENFKQLMKSLSNTISLWNNLIKNSNMNNIINLLFSLNSEDYLNEHQFSNSASKFLSFMLKNIKESNS